jgi:molecular chaperone DnaK
VFQVDLKHKPVGLDSAPLVGGRIVPPSGETLSGFTIELVAEGGGWRSGKLPVSGEGVFTATLRAERGRQNSYSISLFDATGRQQSVSPDLFTYTVGAVVDEQPLINSMGVALANNEFDRILERGRGLPTKATNTYLSVMALKKGHKGAVLRIPVCEGEASKADRNRRVGELQISGDNISRDLPEGSEIEVTLEMDASRILKVRAYVPMLDGDFEANLSLGVSARDTRVVREEVATERERLREIIGKALAVGDASGARRLQSIESGELVAELDVLAKDAELVDAAQKCEHRLLELRCAIDEVADKLEWPGLVAEAHELTERLVDEASRTPQPQLKKQVDLMTRELAKIIDANNIDDLRVKLRQATSLYWRLLSAQPAFWLYQFHEAEKGVASTTDQARASRLCDQGRAFVSQNNVEGLTNVVRELWKLMPADAVEQRKRGYQSGVVKARV